MNGMACREPWSSAERQQIVTSRHLANLLGSRPCRLNDVGSDILDEMVDYEPLPNPEELATLADLLGSPLRLKRRVKGGQSATTDILETPDGTDFALRRHGRWSLGFDDNIAAREAAVLTAVDRAGVPAPRVLWHGPFGATSALVTEAIAGVPVLDPPQPIRWSEQLAEILLRIHSARIDPALSDLLDAAPPAPVDLEPSSGLTHRHPRGEALLAQRVDLSPTGTHQTYLVHGDYWPGNLLWDRGEVAAVLDWEAAVRSDPVADIAYCYTEMRYLGQDEAAEHLVDAYRSLSGRALDTLPYWITTSLCRALPGLETYLDGWRGLGVDACLPTVEARFNRLADEVLGR